MSTPEGARGWLRHCVATVAYRAGKAIRGAPAGFGEFRLADPAAMTPAGIVAHMGDLMEWTLSMAEGRERWLSSTPGSWDAEVRRFFAGVAALDAHLASDAPLRAAPERRLRASARRPRERAAPRPGRPSLRRSWSAANGGCRAG